MAVTRIDLTALSETRSPPGPFWTDFINSEEVS